MLWFQKKNILKNQGPQENHKLTPYCCSVEPRGTDLENLGSLENLNLRSQNFDRNVRFEAP